MFSVRPELCVIRILCLVQSGRSKHQSVEQKSINDIFYIIVNVTSRWLVTACRLLCPVWTRHKLKMPYFHLVIFDSFLTSKQVSWSKLTLDVFQFLSCDLDTKSKRRTSAWKDTLNLAVSARNTVAMSISRHLKLEVRSLRVSFVFFVGKKVNGVEKKWVFL